MVDGGSGQLSGTCIIFVNHNLLKILHKFRKRCPMTKKQNIQHSDNNQQYNEIEHTLFCDSLENQYKQAKKDGLFEVLKVLELDKKHSDRKLVLAIDYFKKKNGIIEKDAPIDFLTEREKRIVNQDGKFRPDLYCMLLSTKFSEAIQNKSAFIQHSSKYSFGS